MVGIEELGGVGAGRQGSREAWRQGGVEVYPNPASEYIMVEISNENELRSGDLLFTIYNSLGKECNSKFIDNKAFKVDVKDFPPVIYWIIISTDNKIERSGKFVIIR